MKDKTTPPAKPGIVGPGCVVLFGLPFFAFGLFALWNLLSMIGLAIQASQWVETSATVLSAELEGNETWVAVAEYQYTYDGEVYRNDRVGLSDMRDNLGSYQKRMHRKLKAACEAEETVPCYVDPSDPTRALLDRRVRPLAVLMWMPFVLGHGLIGGGLIWWGWRSRYHEAKAAELYAAAPDEPWRWREDWAAGEIRSSAASLWMMTGFAFFWNLISGTVAAAFWSSEEKREWWVSLVVGIFPAIGVCLLVWVVPRLVTRWRSGPSLFRLASTPGVIGGKLSGVVLVPRWVERAEEAKLTLTCSRTTGTGEDARTYVAWQDERLVNRFLNASDPGRVGVPIDLTIPSDGVLSTDTEDKVNWSLVVDAKPPRGKFRTMFEVPIFRTEDTQPGITLDDETPGEFERNVELADLLEEEGIRTEALGVRDSVRYTSPPARKWGEAMAMTVAGLAFVGVAGGMFWNGWWLGLAFAVFAPFFLYAALDAWLGTSEVTIRGDRWTVRSGWYGFRGEGERFGPSEIKSIRSVKSNIQSNNTNRPATKHLVAKLKNRKKKLVLVRAIVGTNATRKLLADLHERVGL